MAAKIEGRGSGEKKRIPNAAEAHKERKEKERRLSEIHQKKAADDAAALK